MAGELILPMGRKLPDYLARQMHQCPAHAAKNIGEVFGRGNKPQKPIVVWGPHGNVIAMVAGLGVAEAAELEDIAVAVAENHKPFDFEARRAAYGMPSAQEYDQLFRQALLDKIENHKRHAVTNPGVKKRPKRVF